MIFDLDGVLVHTDRYHYLAWKQISDDMGIYFDEEINGRLRGVSRMESLDIILERSNGPALSQEDKEKLAEKKNEIYRSYLSTMTPDDVSEEVRETLQELKDAGYPLAVGSSSKNTRFILKKTDLESAFDKVADGTMIKRTKPDPEVFQLAAKLLGAPCGQCLVVEDALAGIQAAKAAGMKAAAYGEVRNDHVADYDLAHFSDLKKILL